MSEVNQAFLRAYLKNRAAESSPTSSAPATMDARPPQNPTVVRPSALAPRQPAVPPSHPAQSLPSGMNLRFDPSHAEQIQPSTIEPVVSLPFAAQSHSQPPQERVAPRQGVWSSLGAERGMKALERQSNPAIVRNGVNAIPTEATQYRRPSAPVEQPASIGSKPPVTSPNPNPSASTYDQVMFVDGLHAHTASQRAHGSRPSEQTLAEISEPIAFGTGVPTSLPTNARSQSPIHPAPARSKEVQSIPNEVTRNRRFDPSHLRNAAQQKELELERELINQRQLAHLNELAIQRENANQRELASRQAKAHREQKQRELAQRELAQKELAQRELAQKELAQRELAQRELAQRELAQKELAQRELAQRELAQRELAQRELAQKELAQKNAASIAAQAASKTKAAANVNSIPLPVAFHPSWEVDQFFWPEVVKHIENSNAEAFQQIGKHLSLANRDGLKVMAVTSGERGVGRSTVAMHMARCAASAGLRVALFDGDTYCPSLIDQLRLDMKQGWQDCLFENVPLQDIAVHSLADNITLFPLTSVISQQQAHANLLRMVKLVRRISNAFDMVFIDGSRLNLEQRDLVGVSVGKENVVDAVIVVTDTELSIKEKVDSAVSILQGMGISSIGLVENFQS